MSSHKTARVARVLSGALRVWGVPASVEIDSDGVVLRTSGAMLKITRAVPHGWVVLRDAHSLEMHVGLPGLLRSLRQELAPEVVGGRLIIGSQNLR